MVAPSGPMGPSGPMSGLEDAGPMSGLEDAGRLQQKLEQLENTRGYSDMKDVDAKLPATSGGLDITQLPKQQQPVHQQQPEESVDAFINKYYQSAQTRAVDALVQFHEERAQEEPSLSQQGTADHNRGVPEGFMKSEELDRLKSQILDLSRQEPEPTRDDSALTAEIVSLKDENSKLVAENSELGAKNSALSSELAESKRALMEVTAANGQVKDLSSQLQEFRSSMRGSQEFSMLGAQIKELTRQLEETKNVLSKELLDSRSSLERETSKGSAEVRTLISQVVELTKKLEERPTRQGGDASQTSSVGAAQISELTRQLDEARRDASREAVARSELSKLSRELEESIRSADREAAIGSAEIHSLRAQVAELTQQAEELKKGTKGGDAAAREQILELGRQLEEAKSEAAKEASKRSEALRLYRELESSRHSSDLEADGSSEHIQTLRAKVVELTMQAEALKLSSANEDASRTRISELTRQLEEAKADVSNEKAAQMEVDRLTREMEEYKRSVDQGASQRVAEFDQLKAQVAELSKQTALVQSRGRDSPEADREIGAWQQVAGLTKQLEEAKSFVSKEATARAEVVKLSGQLEQSRQALDKEIATGSKDREALRAEVGELAKQLEESRYQSRMSPRPDEQTTRSYEAVQNNAIRSSLDLSEQKLSEASQLLAVRDRQLAKLTEEVESSRKRVRDMNEELVRVGAFLSSAPRKSPAKLRAGKANASKADKADDGTLPQIGSRAAT